MLIGKGIGFKKTINDILTLTNVENIFLLINQEEQSLYIQLLKTTPAKIMNLSAEIIADIQSQIPQTLNEHIHIALTDHIATIVRRSKLNMQIENPFLHETNSLYPKEAAIAQEVVKKLESELEIVIEPGEVGFITLHIVTATNNKSLSSLYQETKLIAQLKIFLEQQLDVVINPQDMNYVRLVTHIRFMLERLERNEQLAIPEEVEDTIRENYPYFYNLAWKLIKVIQKNLKQTIDGSETSYVALHLYRFAEGQKLND